MLDAYWKNLEAVFIQHGDKEIAIKASAYMRNQFDYFGIKAPIRTQLLNEFYKNNPIPAIENIPEIIKSAWEHPCREMQYAAMEVLFKLKKKTGIEILDLYEYLITQKSWWDTVDYIAPNLLGHYFQLFPEQQLPTINKWLNSNNLWLQRSCLIFQLRYKKQTDEALLFQLCSDLANEKDFFIRKAIGWSLREYAKQNPEAVIAFVNKTPLSGLSQREALKHQK